MRRGPKQSRLALSALLVVAIVLLTGCTRRQLAPGLIAGAGAILTTSGAIYRATLDTDEAFGDTPGEVAGTTVLIFGGIGLLVTGIIWSATSSRCDENRDCWSGDVCERRSHTCIDGEAARRLQRPQVDQGDAGVDGDVSDGEAGDAGDAEVEETPPYPG